MMRLLPEVDRYGEDIEYDLLTLPGGGIDLLDFFRGVHSWRRLRVILDRLPRNSRYVLAKKNDPEIALEVARAQREARAAGKGGRWHPPADEWDTSAELLATVADRLGEVEALLASMPVATDKHGKPVKRQKPPKEFPRPLSAIEEADRVLGEQHVEEIIADVEAAYVSAEDYARMAAEQERYRQANDTA
jgi:hypothetical protein